MLNDVVVIDDFFGKTKFQWLKNIVTSSEQYWYFTETITGDEFDNKKFYGFSCEIVPEGYPDQYINIASSQLIFSLNEQIKKTFSFDKVIRTRLDMTTYRGQESIRFNPHVDIEGKHFTSIFYLTTCNAPTIIYEEKSKSTDIDLNLKFNVLKKIEAKENRLVVFDGHHIHTGMCATDVSRRILINSNFI